MLIAEGVSGRRDQDADGAANDGPSPGMFEDEPRNGYASRTRDGSRTRR
jgi:hypothetical protein